MGETVGGGPEDTPGDVNHIEIESEIPAVVVQGSEYFQEDLSSKDWGGVSRNYRIFRR